MYPILVSIGPLALSSFGLFLSLAILFGSFVIWRLAKVYDLDPEKVLDLILLTFIGGLLGARLYFVALNFSKFNSLTQIILINRYPGLTFWGGLFLGIVVLYLLSKRLKFDFWLIADLAAVGLFLGLAVGSIGCLLAGCQYGVPTNSLLAVTQVGLIAKRFPIQALYSLMYLIGFFMLWGICLRFHFKGKVATLGLIVLTIIIFFLGFFRADSSKIYAQFSLDHFISAVLFIVSLVIYYHQSRRSLKRDLNSIMAVFVSSKSRNLLLSKFLKSWYNFQVNLRLLVTRWYKKATRKFHVKSNPTQF